MPLAIVGGQPISALPTAPVAIAQGGHGQVNAAAGLAALGGLDTTSHAGVNHAGLPGVGDLTTAAHGSLDHTGIPGVNTVGYIMWFVPVLGVSAGVFLRPYGLDNAITLTNNGVRAPRAGTLSVAVFDGNTNMVDYIIHVGGSTFNTGFVSDGGVVNPGLAVNVGDVVRVQVNTVGTGSNAAWSLLIQ